MELNSQDKTDWWAGPDCLIREVSCSDEFMEYETEKVAFQVTPELHAYLLKVVDALKVFQDSVGDQFASADTRFRANYVTLKTDWDSEDECLVVAEGDRFDSVAMQVDCFNTPRFEVRMGIKHTSATLMFDFDLAQLESCLQAHVSQAAQRQLEGAFAPHEGAGASSAARRGPSL